MAYAKNAASQDPTSTSEYPDDDFLELLFSCQGPRCQSSLLLQISLESRGRQQGPACYSRCLDALQIRDSFASVSIHEQFFPILEICQCRIGNMHASQLNPGSLMASADICSAWPGRFDLPIRRLPSNCLAHAVSEP